MRGFANIWLTMTNQLKFLNDPRAVGASWLVALGLIAILVGAAFLPERSATETARLIDVGTPRFDLTR